MRTMHACYAGEVQAFLRYRRQPRLSKPKEAPWLAAFLHEMLAFPNSRHDDQIDSVSQFLYWAEAHPPIVICPPIVVTLASNSRSCRPQA